MKQAGSETELLAEVTQRLQLLRVLDQTLQRHVKTRNRRCLDLQWEWQHWNIRQRYRQWDARSEEHTSELQSLMRISYAVFCLKKKTRQNRQTDNRGNTK